LPNAADIQRLVAALRDTGPVSHSMFKRVAAWNEVAVESALDLLR